MQSPVLKTIPVAVSLFLFSFTLSYTHTATAQTSKPPLEKKVFIHYKNNPSKPDSLTSPGKNRTTQCYKFLAKGLAWKNLPQTYVIDADNSGMQSQDVVSAITQAFNEWDLHTSALLFNNYQTTNNATWDSDTPDGRNEILFGNYPQNGVIAITVTWGYFSGPVTTREITEFDVMFDTDFNWGDAVSNPALMDLQNIATHEIGHGLGLSDLYETACNQVTMFGYSTEGDTSKRTLDPADITGLTKLYGI